MRIGIDGSNLRTGGGVTHLVQLLTAADPKAAGISGIVVWAGRETLGRLPPRSWLTAAHEPALDRALPHRLTWQRFVLPARARQACDVLFAPGGTSPGSFGPFVTMSRNLLPFQAAERRHYGASWMYVKLGLLKRGQARTFRRADGVIFLNDYARTCVLTEIGPVDGATTVIPHGVDTAFRAAPRPARELATCSDADPFRVLYVSTVEPYKHQWHVVEAVAGLRKEGLPLRLDLIGGGHPPSVARLVATMQRCDPVSRFTSYHHAVDHRQLPAHYQRADMFVFASSCENMPNILLEAMAAGLPIACAERGPMPAMLGDGGVYFDPLSPGSIRRAIAELAESVPLRAQLAARAFGRAGDFTWERCAADTLAFLRRVGDTAGRC